MGYHCLWDCRRRLGERTERGMFAAARDRAAYAAIFDAYTTTC
jgi:hypothetical protein